MIYISLLLGILIGFFNLIPKRILKYNDLFTTIGVLVLLFVMGMSIGVEEDVIKDLKNLGLVSLVFTFLTIIFSILVVYFITKLTFKDQTS